MRIRLLPVALVLALCTLPRAGMGQAVHGLVVDAGNVPLPGVVVQLLDTRSAVVGRTLSSAGGEYHLPAPGGGSYRIKTMRIGFRSTTTEPFSIGAREDVVKRLVLNNIGISLDTMRVVGKSSCRLAADSGAATFAVWEQVRTALTAAEISGKERIAGTTFSFERTLDADNLKLLKQRSALSTSFINEPWLSLSPQALHRVGFVTIDTSNATTYNAPGIDVLLSSVFLEDHCFHLRSAGSLLGIEFVPAPERQHLAEIRGTLWLDRATSELRSLEYAYANISPEQEARARGEMTFVRMRDGTWAISRWEITMPVVEMKVVNGHVQRTAVGAQPELKVYDLIVRGGELVMARRGADTIWAQPPRTLTGSVTDSSSGHPIAGARVALFGTPFEVMSDSGGHFRVEGLLPGNYTVEVHTPSLDSVGAAHQSPLEFTQSTSLDLRVPAGKQVFSALCGNSSREFPGVLVGTVTIKDNIARPHGMNVGVEWESAGMIPGSPEHSLRAFETRTDDHGQFRFCGVPVGIELTLRTLADTGSAQPLSVTIPPGVRFASALMEHDYEARGGAAFVGMIAGDSGSVPIAGAQVSMPEIQRATVSGENGIFRINDIPPGSYAVLVRRVGYGPLETTVTFLPNQMVDRRVVLSKAVVLETVVVAESQLPREFEENRRLGMGSFVTRSEIEKQRGTTTMTVLQGLREIHFIHGRGGHAYVTAARPPHSGCTNEPCLREERLYYVPDNAEKLQGVVAACYAQVYLDNMLLNPGRPTEPFDVGSLPVDEIEGIEFYPSRLQTPTKYHRSVGCGVLQIWTRKSAD